MCGMVFLVVVLYDIYFIVNILIRVSVLALKQPFTILSAEVKMIKSTIEFYSLTVFNRLFMED